MSPDNSSAGTSTDESDLTDQAVETVRRWCAESASAAAVPSAARLAGLLNDPHGFDFTVGFLDRVVRPEDLRVAGQNLEDLSRRIPAFLPAHFRVAIQLGGGFAPLVPRPIVPLARRVLRQMAGHLVLDATPRQLDRDLNELRQSGIRLNLAVVGEAAVGDAEADRRLESTRELLARHDVDYLSIRVSSLVSRLSMWSFEETVARVVDRLTPLFEFAADSATRKFISLDLEEFRDLDLTIEVFRRILEKPRLKMLEAGITLQAYLPDSFRAMRGLTAWATQRRAQGGAGIKVRLVKGTNLQLERVDATLNGWPLAPWDTKQQTDTNYKRILDWSLTPERADAVRVGVAGHNLFDIAHAWLLAKQRRVDARIDFEMLLGMGTAQADSVKRDVGGLVLYSPIVHPAEFDSAIPYLIRRLEEHSSSENFLSGAFDLASDENVFKREAERFRASVAGLASSTPISPDGQLSPHLPLSHRTQDRRRSVPVAPVDTAPRVFVNDPATDPSIAGNRFWGREILTRVATSRLGIDASSAARVSHVAALDSIIERTGDAGVSWGERRADTRATVLHSVGDAIAAARAELIEVMLSETGKTLVEADSDVSVAVDFAHYYAENARELDRVPDAEFAPSRLTVVVPPWNSPVATAAGSIIAALAAGSGVIVLTPPQSRRSSAVLVQALHFGGLPAGVLSMVELHDESLSRQLIEHREVDRVILTGDRQTAALFHSWRPGLPLLAATGGTNAIIVTPSADLDLAVTDIVKSAFSGAGQKHSAASLVILVGSVAASARFRSQLIDAVASLPVGYPDDPAAVVGPIIAAAEGPLLAALTTLGEGESWLVKPRLLRVGSGAFSGELWSPGVRDGIAPRSDFHLVQHCGPVLGIMHAATLADAIELQNAPGSGLVAGLYSLDAAEISTWVEEVQAGSLAVNRAITGAIVRRQPFGGWMKSSIGAGAKTGGPNYLLALGRWKPVFAEPGQSVKIRGVSDPVVRVIEAAQPGMEFLEFDRVRAGARSDQRAWEAEYGVARDISALGVERNVLRYLPVPVALRLAEGATSAQLVRLLVAATRAGSAVSISSALPVPAGLVLLFASEASPLQLIDLVVETDASWLQRLSSGETGRLGRIRLVEGNAAAVAEALAGDLDVALYDGEVTTSGRIELLAFLQEQSISITAHRFGNPDPSTFVHL